MAILDDLDRRLLHLLQEDARRSFRELARRAGTTTPTAASRVRRMEGLRIIQGYTVRLDPARFGAAAPDVDVDAPVALACHTCGRQTRQPVWDHVGDRRHPFCCATCRQAFRDRHDRLAEKA